jgi:hypothetical protein
MQTHLKLRTLKGNTKPEKDVQVLFAVQPDEQAIVFIHGFTGHPTRTWSDFDQLLQQQAACKGRDMFFYGFDGLYAEMNASAAIFREFVNRLFVDTKELLKANLPAEAQRPPSFQYRSMLIVAHSLGAVTSRRALLDASKMGVTWLSRINLVLFAPAHLGASVAELALEATGAFSFLRLFGAGARFASPLIDQLKPGSADLKTLLDETTAALAGGANTHLIARKVIIAERERIVKNASFASDPPAIAIPDTTHTTVCKPSSTFILPLQRLLECL